jgi:maltooligosyltrehalose trehalohydrolase
MKFEIWAPFAKELALILDDHEAPMNPGEHGWWSLDVQGASAGSKYSYRVNGEGPFPDPRSAWQPEGVHGPSMVIDHAAFSWNDDEFKAPPFSEAIIYELHVGTFSPEGTYSGAAAKLPHLRGLGITFIELLPINTFAGSRGWGYDGVALYAPHPDYGTPEDLKRFIQSAHEHGIGVLLDVVYNHFGPDGNYATKFGPYFTDRFHTPWGNGVNVDDTDSPGVRAHFIENALMWLRDYHFDGLRMDAVDRIIDLTAFHFLEEMSTRIAALSAEVGRPLVITVENDTNSPRLVHPIARGGYGLDAHWCDDFHHAVHATLTGETGGYYADYSPLASLAKALRQGYVYDGQYSNFRRRAQGRPPEGVKPSQLVVCAQNHDQIGNRAFGERLGHLIDGGLLRAAPALTLLSPFTPLLFMGEEWNAATPFQFFSEHHNELGRLVTEGRRREFAHFNWGDEIPDPQSPETFRNSKLNWAELDEEAHREMLGWYCDLIALRKTIPRGTPAEVAFDESARWLTLRRGTLLAVFNFAGTPQPISLPHADWQPRFPGNPVVFPARSTTILTTAA